ncbi:neuronal calcium sensor 2 [Brachionus plicatilis]|uniref:Neuronal calcium sensor 2 n=1 Tax=Brachionus plicatilis TaxID=10195 RepID=A0A3M7SAQ6_BRAPC|nr:neuronal calcium sensor 2 [Brachionus plicatilis]
MNYRRDSAKKNLSEDDIEFIAANTDFDRNQILEWYEEFRQKCPNNQLNKASFVKFYKSLIPGDSKAEDSFCEHVFSAFDTDNNGYIDFSEFLIAFWIRSKGSLKDKLNWLFDIYDMDKSNYITPWELSRMLRLVFSMKSINDDPYLASKQIFDDIDRSKDGRLTRQEFIAGCTKYEKYRNLFAPF